MYLRFSPNYKCYSKLELANSCWELFCYTGQTLKSPCELILLYTRYKKFVLNVLCFILINLCMKIKRSTVSIICQHIKCRTDHFRMCTYIHHHTDMLLPCKKASPFLQRMCIWFKEDPLQKIRISSNCWINILAGFTLTTAKNASMI